MKHSKIVACDTMNYWIDSCPDLLMEVVRRVQIIFINEDEIKSLCKENNIFVAGEKLLSEGPELVIVKRGEYGSVALGKDFVFFAPVYPVKDVIDPTGAGDSFAGGFMGTLVEKGVWNVETIKEAVLSGTITASFNIESFSSDKLRKAERADIEDRKASLKNYIRI
jgi:sugar/nucleoside kinase (ribokinase family)